jgi:hypothetical protein
MLECVRVQSMVRWKVLLLWGALQSYQFRYRYSYSYLAQNDPTTDCGELTQQLSTKPVIPPIPHVPSEISA